jgi:hypothetical protein
MEVEMTGEVGAVISHQSGNRYGEVDAMISHHALGKFISKMHYFSL